MLLALADRAQVGLDAVLVELGRDQRQGQPRAEDGDVAALAQQVGQRADVVLVAVGQHDGVDVVEPVAEGRPVGQRDVDAGGVGLAEQHAAVDDEQPAAAGLEHRHVAADLLDAAERDDAQAARARGGGSARPVRSQTRLSSRPQAGAGRVPRRLSVPAARCRHATDRGARRRRHHQDRRRRHRRARGDRAAAQPRRSPRSSGG